MLDDPLIGQQLSNFLIERVLGRGGMAQVYYGQDVKLQRPVAIKVIDARYRSKPSYAQRFVKEARAVARWRHEHIIQIYYADDQDGLYYYVMEYIDGQDLASLMTTHASEGELLPPDEVIRISRAIADALDYAHSQGVIHRDVKPSNVMLSKDGRVILGDFGLALDMQEGSSGEVFGTPSYISPEQARRSKEVVPQSDLYSLGVILYEMLTGVVPFDDLSPTSVALQHITQPPPPPRSINPQLNKETEAVLLKALSKKPEDRYKTGKALIDALEKALAHLDDAQEKVLPLPPMPAGILTAHDPTVAQIPMGGPAIPIRPATSSDEAGEGAKGPSAQPGKWPIVGIVVLALMLLAGGGLWLQRGSIPVAGAPSASATASLQPKTSSPLPVIPIASATPTQTMLPATALASASPTGTRTPTLTDSPQPSATALPTETETAPPSDTPSPSPTATAEPLVLTATVTVTPKHQDGKRFLIFYDEHGLYLLNVSDANRAVTPFAFERLDNNGTPGDRFDGWRWAQFAPTSYPNTCIKIEILKSPEYLRPAQCENRYIGSRFYESSSSFVFWTAKANSHEFRVLWMDEEVARCEIGSGVCEVFVP